MLLSSFLLVTLQRKKRKGSKRALGGPKFILALKSLNDSLVL